MKHLIIILLSLNMAGCISYEKCPKEWRNDEEISKYDLTGIYECNGQSPSGQLRYGLNRLFLDRSSFLDQYISFQWSNQNVLEINLLGKDQTVIDTKILDIAQNDCSYSDGWLSIDVTRFENQDGVLVAEFGSIQIQPLKKHLIVKSKGYGFGVVWLVPLMGGSTSWTKHNKK